MKHGHATRSSRSPTYNSWYNMMTRCYNHKHHAFHRYGGRGIKVCSEWHFFKNFLKDMGERPNSMYLERSDNNGNYEPNNCIWATKKQQAQNTIHTKKVANISYDVSCRKYKCYKYDREQTPWKRVYLGRFASFKEAQVHIQSLGLHL